MPKPPRSRRPFLRFDSTGKNDARKLLQHGKHLPLVGRNRSLDKLDPAYIAMLEGPDGKPWRITLKVISKEGGKFRPVTYFARGRDPHAAIIQAERFWKEVEKTAKGQEHERYPDVLGSAHAVCLDEGDWAEYLRDAKRFGSKRNLSMCCKGDPRHPFMFTVPGLVFDVGSDQEATSLDYESLTSIKPLGD